MDESQTLSYDGILAQSEQFLLQISEFVQQLRSKSLSSSIENTVDVVKHTRQMYVQTEDLLPDFSYRETKEVGIQTDILECSNCHGTAVETEPGVSPISLNETLDVTANYEIVQQGEPQETGPTSPLKEQTEKNCNAHEGKLTVHEYVHKSTLTEAEVKSTSILNSDKPNIHYEPLKREEVLEKGNAAEKAIAEDHLEDKENCHNENKSILKEAEVKTETTSILNLVKPINYEPLKREEVLEKGNAAEKAVAEDNLEDKENSHNENKSILKEVEVKTENTSILNLVKPNNYKPVKREELTIKGNAEDVVNCLRIAEKAIAENNLVKAKRILLKSERIHPTAEAKAYLEIIKTVEAADQSEKSGETVQKDPIKYDTEENQNKISLTENSVENQPQSEIKKPRHSLSQTAAKKLVSHLHDKKNQFKESSASHINNNNNKSMGNDEVKLLASAFIAMAEEEYKFAETLLTKACMKKNMLAKVYLHTLKAKNVKNKYVMPKIRKHASETSDQLSEKHLKALNEQHYEIANYLLAQGIFTLPELILTLAEKFHTSEASHKLLKDVQGYLESNIEPFMSNSFAGDLNKAYKHFTGNLRTVNIFGSYQYSVSIKEEAAKYIELAKAALAKKNIEKAVVYIDKSQHFAPSEAADELLCKLKLIQPDISTDLQIPASHPNVCGEPQNNHKDFIATNESEWPAFKTKRLRLRKK